MADSDNTTTLPFVTRGRESWTTPVARPAGCEPTHATTLADPALALSLAWTEAHAATAEQCLKQQQLETASSLAGIAAKLSVIALEAEDNTDLADFPVSHVRSALEDLQRLMGRTIVDSCPAPKSDREDVGGTDPCRAQRQVIQRER